MRTNTFKKLTIACSFLIVSLCTFASERFVSFDKGDLLIAQKGHTVKVYVDPSDNIAVRKAVNNLLTDIENVSGAEALLVNSPDEARIVVGTINDSKAIREMVKEKSIDIKQLKNKTEKYISTVINNQLIIAGSDRRGAVYGVYELSSQMGVSPWYYWMDTPIKHHEKVFALKGVYTDGEPAVRYRGIFLNDEAPCLTTWVKNTFGTGYGGHDFYEKVFELVLRLKGNYIWPAMWGWAFYANDPENSRVADEMGIMVGTSHHEPMSRSQQEWKNRAKWDYTKSKSVLDDFWRGGVERNKNTEDIITIGMRGDGDEAMSEERNTKLLEDIVANQRKIISEVRGKKANQVPQLWALYKEVLDYYDDGMRVPDDVTILLCDDNWGNIRRVPTAKERNRKGGWGLYYHVDYVGAPRNSKLLNVTPTQNMWEQLTLAYDYGLDRLWILNVGDLKPMEYPIQLFMDMAWNPREFTAKNITDHTLRFCNEQFGTEQGTEAARILNLIGKYNGRCTPELLTARTYDLASGEWLDIVSQYRTLESEALRQFITLPEESRDAYRQLILFPVQLMTNLHEMYYAQAQNHRKGADMDIWAERCRQYFERDSVLMAEYNNDIAGGKWNGMMIQKHIGYFSWNDNFPKDRLPKLFTTANTPVEPASLLKSAKQNQINIEAEHFVEKNAPEGTEWTVIPHMGKWLSAVALMPYTASVDGAWLRYEFTTPSKADSISLKIITKSTLDFLNKGGLRYSVSIDGGEPIVVNFNANLNEKPENIYSIYYPTVANRIVEKSVSLPLKTTANGHHTITYAPLDPAIVLERLVIDAK